RGPGGRTRLGCRHRAVRRGDLGLADLGAFAIELEEVVLLLLGDLEPDEESGEDDERDDNQRGEGDAERDGDGLERLHGSILRAVGWWSAVVVRRLRASASASGSGVLGPG